MREIQFRAWYPEKHKMYEVAKVDMWGDLEQATCDLAAIDEELFDIYLHEVETMQYTGLKDKNGKKIFEGDILERGGFWGWYVAYEDGGFRKIPINTVQRINWEHSLLEQDTMYYWEIIGNIHDNPELVEEEMK